MIVAASVITSLTALFKAFDVICEAARLIRSADIELLMLEIVNLLEIGHIAPDDALVVPYEVLCRVQLYEKFGQC